MEVVQQCLEKEELIFQYHTEKNLNVAGKDINTIAGFPLITKGGDLGGTLCIMCDHSISDGYQELIQSATSLIDSAIVTEKRTNLMVSRYTKYVGTEIMNELLLNPAWLNPRKEEVVIISVDLVGSTKYAHSEPDALEVFRNINKYLRLVANIIKNKHHGTLDKYIGDEIMGIFGAPVKNVNCISDGIECAFDILQSIEKFNETRSQNENPIFSVKITLGFAQVVAGEVGSKDTQTDYTVLGDGVNSIFRIAKYTEPNKIYINNQLNDKVQNIYKTAFIGTFEAKGIEEGLPIYELQIP